MVKLPHEIAARKLHTTTSGIPFPGNPPSDGQIITYSGTTGELHWADNQGGGESQTGGDSVKVSSNDTTADFLGNKLVAGTGISLTEQNDGSNETLEVASTASAAQGDFLVVSLPNGTSLPATDNPIPFDTVVTSRGNLSLDSGTGHVSGLKAGRTYLLFYSMAYDNGNAWITAGFYNVTQSQEFGTSTVHQLVNRSASTGEMTAAQYVFAPDEDTEIAVHITNQGGSGTFQGHTHLLVAEIGITPAPPGQGDYIRVSLSTNQADISDNTPVALDTIHEQRGGLSLSSNQITGFKADHTYLLVGEPRMIHTTGARLRFQFYDVTASALLGQFIDLRTPTYSQDESEHSSGSVIFNPSVDSVVEFRKINDSDSQTVDVRSGTEVIVLEIGAAPVATTDEKFIGTIRCGSVESHNSDTPKVVSQFQFDPTEYDLSGATRSITFKAVAANGGGATSTKVDLYSLTDAENIATLNFDNAAPTVSGIVLTEGTGSGEIDPSPKIYEVRILVDSPDGIDDTIELGSAELQVVSTLN